MPSRGASQTREDSAAVLLQAAQRFEQQGRAAVADALYEMILERYGGTAAAAAVQQLRLALPPDRGRTGAVELQVWGTTYGLWLGVALPLLFDADGPEPYGLGLLLGGPAGFFTSRAYARSRPLTEGQARAITWGGTWGTWQGLGWAHVLDLGRRTERFCPDPAQPQFCFDVEEGDATQEIVASMLVGGLAGIVTGAILSHKPISPGLATTFNHGSLWGSWFGLATSVLLDLEDDDLLAGTLIGGNAALLTTAVLGPRWQLSRNRARLISIAGVVGGIGGGGIDLLVQPDDERVAIAIPLAGSIAGLLIGALTTRDYDRPRAGAGRNGGALLDVGSGRLALDAPHLSPMLLPKGPTGSSWQPALGLTLVRARF